MISIPFTPPTASINRVHIVDLPGLPIDEAARDRKAYHLLSAETVVRLARARADELGLPTPLRNSPADDPPTRAAVPRHVDACLSSADPVARAAAEAIARRLGRNLAHILVTLHRGDPVNRAARAEWTADEWEHWHTIRQVWIGGGLVSGELGEQLVMHAHALLREWGYADALAVARTAQPRNMPLIGAARYLPPGDYRALCLDFGQSSVKRAWAHVAGQTLDRLESLPTLETPWCWHNSPEAQRSIVPASVRDFVSEVISQALAGERAHPDVMLSVAAYVRGGTLLGNGIYAQLMRLCDDVRPLLAEAVAERCGVLPHIHPIHDGTAAATLHAGAPHAAVLVIGTAIGVGFPPADFVDSLIRRFADSLIR